MSRRFLAVRVSHLKVLDISGYSGNTFDTYESQVEKAGMGSA